MNISSKAEWLKSWFSSSKSPKKNGNADPLVMVDEGGNDESMEIEDVMKVEEEQTKGGEVIVPGHLK